MTNSAAQTAAQTDRQPRADLIGRYLGLAPQPQAQNSDRAVALAILLEEIQDSGDAVLLFQVAEMALGMGKRLAGC